MIMFRIDAPYVKGVPFFNKRYIKGVPFLPKWYMKGKGVGPRGGATTYKTLLSTPPPPPPPSADAEAILSADKFAPQEASPVLLT